MVFGQPINSDLKTYKKLETLLQDKKMITQLVVCLIILTLKIISS